MAARRRRAGHRLVGWLPARRRAWPPTPTRARARHRQRGAQRPGRRRAEQQRQQDRGGPARAEPLQPGGRAQVRAQHQHPQALHRRPQLDDRRAQLRHAAAVARPGLRGRLPDLQLPRPLRRAALEHDHARGDCAGRRALRPVLGDLPGQLDRHHGGHHRTRAARLRGLGARHRLPAALRPLRPGRQLRRPPALGLRRQQARLGAVVLAEREPAELHLAADELLHGDGQCGRRVPDGHRHGHAGDRHPVRRGPEGPEACRVRRQRRRHRPHRAGHAQAQAGLRVHAGDRGQRDARRLDQRHAQLEPFVPA